MTKARQRRNDLLPLKGSFRAIRRACAQALARRGLRPVAFTDIEVRIEPRKT